MQPLRAKGRTRVRAPPEAIRTAILDPAVLAWIIPGAERVTRISDGTFIAILGLGVGRFRGRQTATLRVESESGGKLSVSGRATGPFGSGDATGHIQLDRDGGGTLVAWRYDGQVSGPFTLAGPLLLRLSATAFTARVFRRLQSVVERDFGTSLRRRLRPEVSGAAVGPRAGSVAGRVAAAVPDAPDSVADQAPFTPRLPLAAINGSELAGFAQHEGC